MSRGPDAHTLLLRALAADSQARGLATDVTGSDWARWASATFTGARHTLTITGRGLEAWLAGLPEHDFALRGHLVADLTISHVRHDGEACIASLEVLTVEER